MQHVSQRGFRLIKQEEQGISQDVLCSRPPRSIPQLAEHANKPGSGKRPLCLRHVGQRIESQALFWVGHIEVDNITLPLTGYFIEHALDQITVRVKERCAASRVDVLEDELLNQR